MRQALFAAIPAAVALVLAVGWARRRWVIVTVDGESMVPAYPPGERIRVLRVRAAAIRTGDVVVFERPPDGRRGDAGGPRRPAASGVEGAGRWMIKRAAAVPGDLVPPAAVPFPVRAGERVPAGMYVLLGDNTAASFDSRMFGYVPAARILGVAAGDQGRGSSG